MKKFIAITTCLAFISTSMHALVFRRPVATAAVISAAHNDRYYYPPSLLEDNEGYDWWLVQNNSSKTIKVGDSKKNMVPVRPGGETRVSHARDWKLYVKVDKKTIPFETSDHVIDLVDDGYGGVMMNPYSEPKEGESHE